ncbi:hypothetical protein ACJ73_04829 [Blastomyces percursus]|uniref:PNPLA domain-containing protein n=1 Tax=Blastomyces percursus TaxID=1658174 RepID=A0A1J9Q5R0_9EURO|nr:hypothetical protein ACJ73_04829 [Blastomyces percursus]
MRFVWADDAGWLDVITGEHGDIRIRDRGRLGQVLRELKDPTQQHPALLLFLGGDTKDETLGRIFIKDAVHTSKSDATIRLRRGATESGTEDAAPILIADGDLHTAAGPQYSRTHLQDATYPATWTAARSEDVLHLIYARLVFLFCDVVCIFTDDFPGLDYIADFLLFVAQAGSASILPVQVRPTVLVVLASGSAVHGNPQMDEFHRKLSACREGICEAFSTVRTVPLDDDTARGRPAGPGGYGQLKNAIQHHLDHATAMRSAHRARFTGLHIDQLFGPALEHTAMTVTEPFDHIRKMRAGNEVATDLSHHLTNYLRLGLQAKIRVEDLLPSIASAIVADNYPPRAHLSDSNLVFKRLYREPLFQALRPLCTEQLTITLAPDAVCKMVEVEIDRFLSSMEGEHRLSAELHQEQLMSQSALFYQVRSDRTCLWCRFRKPEHRPSCGHGLCDVCVRRYGDPAPDVEYRLTIRLCFLCLSRVPLVIDLVPPTKRISILAIDGGGVRGIIPLEFLLLVQEKLGRDCPVVDLCDLIMGTSSGGIIAQAMVNLRWDVATCSEVYEQLARRVFRRRRQAPFACLHRSFLGGLCGWFARFLYDGLYDAAILESSLRENFGESLRTFHAAGHDRSGALLSRTKVGVVATDISRKTSTFVFGNFNGAEVDSTRRGYELVRPDKDDDDPFVWQIVSCALGTWGNIFPPAYIRAIGTFQDGGLRENNPAVIARRVSRQIWPSKKVPALVISIGTGTEEDYRSDHEENETSGQEEDETSGQEEGGKSGQVAPHFRNVFKDGFARRAFDAWLSSLDGEAKWRDLLNHLSDDEKADHIRFNVPLMGVASTIDSVSDINGYRDLVILHPGSAKKAADVASALLVSAFYLVLAATPDGEEGQFSCLGTIRCRPQIRSILPPLKALHESHQMCFVTETGFLAPFLGEADICPSCGRYCKPVLFHVRHLDEEITIFLKLGRGWRRKISARLLLYLLEIIIHAHFHDAKRNSTIKACSLQKGKGNTAGWIQWGRGIINMKVVRYTTSGTNYTQKSTTESRDDRKILAPWQSTQSLGPASKGIQATTSRTGQLVRSIFPGLSRVSTGSFKDNINKARDIALENCLDLKQIFADEDPNVFLKHGVKMSATRRFISDIPLWIEYRKRKRTTEDEDISY